MKRANELALVRARLDDAITHGRFGLAKRLAFQGLKRARTKELLGEMEYFKGQVALLSGDYQKAIGHFDRAVARNPHDGAAFNDRALCMVELGSREDALVYFDKGIEVEPDYATVYHNKGWLLNKVGRHQEAIGCFQKALELEPGRAVTYENLADALAHLADHRGALAAYEKALRSLKPAYRDIKRQIVSQMKDIEEKIGHA